MGLGDEILEIAFPAAAVVRQEQEVAGLRHHDPAREMDAADASRGIPADRSARRVARSARTRTVTVKRRNRPGFMTDTAASWFCAAWFSRSMIAATSRAAGGRSIGTSRSSRRRNRQYARSAPSAASTKVAIATLTAQHKASQALSQDQPCSHSTRMKARTDGMASGQRKVRANGRTRRPATGRIAAMVKGRFASVPPCAIGFGFQRPLHSGSLRISRRAASSCCSALACVRGADSDSRDMCGEIAFAMDPLDRKSRRSGEIDSGIGEPGLADRDDMGFQVGEQGPSTAVDRIGKHRTQLLRDPLVDLLQQVVDRAVAGELEHQMAVDSVRSLEHVEAGEVDRLHVGRAPHSAVWSPRRTRSKPSPPRCDRPGWPL